VWSAWNPPLPRDPKGKKALKIKDINASFGATAGCKTRLAQLAAPVK
jgi:hypothetical protein